MRWNGGRYRFLYVLLGVAAAIVLLFLLRGVLLPFVLGGALAYILFPVIKAIERITPWTEKRPNLSRVTAILSVYAVFLALVTLILILVVPPAVRQSTNFVNSLPVLYERAQEAIYAWSDQLGDRLPADVRAQIDEALENLGSTALSAVRNVVSRTVGFFSRALTILIALAAVPILLYYFLKDNRALTEGIISWFPPNGQQHARNVIAEVNDVFGAYIRGQLILGVIVGVLVFVGLFLLDIRFPVLLAIIAGITELIPVIGPWLGAIPAVLVTVATSPEKTIWVILLYFGIQLVENSFLVPRIQSHALDLHPVVIIATLLVGSEFVGLWGVILGPPVVAAAKEIFKYFRQHGIHAQLETPVEPVEETASEDSQPSATESQAYRETE